jgi:hypothetical protein
MTVILAVIYRLNGFLKICSQRFVVSHTGGAVGASSVLLILPSGPEADHQVGVVGSAPSNPSIDTRCEFRISTANFFQKSQNCPSEVLTKFLNL